jgi:hypothetical protein
MITLTRRGRPPTVTLIDKTHASTVCKGVTYTFTTTGGRIVPSGKDTYALVNTPEYNYARAVVRRAVS